jgi:phosphate transport system protein
MEIPGELRRQYRAEKSNVEDQLLAMGGTVLELLAEAASAFEAGDAARAEAVRRADERLDADSHVLQDRILRLLALEAPVASELRIVALYLFANLHLERMGDLCANLARAAEEARPAEEDRQVREQVGEMARHAARVIEAALLAFSRRDVELARTLPELDEPLDLLNQSILRRLAEVVASEGEFDWAMRLVLVARYLERMADHAVDLGEQTIYAVTGELERLG